MEITADTELKFGLFKKEYFFEGKDKGVVVEKSSMDICVYGTDREHQYIFAAITLKIPAHYKKNPLKICEKGDRIYVISESWTLYIDFEKKKCACNTEGAQIFGSKYWGENLTVPYSEEP